MFQTNKNKSRPKLGDLLQEAGLLTMHQLQQALAYQENQNVKLGEALVALNLLTQEQLENFLIDQKKRLRIGELLVKAGKITTDQMQIVLAEMKQSGGRFGEVLVRLNFMGEKDFYQHLAQMLGVPFIDVIDVQIDDKIVQLLSEENSRNFRAVALRMERNAILIGMADPGDLLAAEEIQHLLHKPVNLALVVDRQITQILNKVFKKGEAIQGLVQELGEEVNRRRVDLNQFLDEEVLSEAPVVRILRSIFEDAIQYSASDIHIEPGNEVLRIRKRVDGVLQERVIREKYIAPSLISKIKLMSDLDISERRLPQDGRFNMRLGDVEFDVRVSTLPVQYGESVVLRILNQSAGNIRLDQLGFPLPMQTRLRNWISQPYGLVLVAGPTGSGKTTTLYGMLNELNRPDRKLITVEDPVEYRLDRINQVQVNPKIGLHAANILRTVLRQDPDVILVGEIRDQETMDLAIRASLTGHLVLSTLHTNDAPSTAARLMDMQAKGYAVASSLIGILAQRLVRKICRMCARPYEPTVQEIAWMEANQFDQFSSLMMGVGCQECHQSGYAGRISVGEMLEIDADLATALRKDDTELFLQRAVKKAEYVPLHQAALDYAVRGLTTLREAIRLGGGTAW